MKKLTWKNTIINNNQIAFTTDKAVLIKVPHSNDKVVWIKKTQLFAKGKQWVLGICLEWTYNIFKESLNGTRTEEDLTGKELLGKFENSEFYEQ